MDHAPRATPPPWDLLPRDLNGYFAARAVGLLASEFALLDRGGREFGRLRLAGAEGAELRIGGQTAALEASAGRFRMVSEGREVLAGAPERRSIDELTLHCDGRTYEAWTSFFRNRAVASRPGVAEAASISGGFAGRSYAVRFDAGDACGLPVAVSLLWHLAANRRRVYLRGGPT